MKKRAVDTAPVVDIKEEIRSVVFAKYRTQRAAGAAWGVSQAFVSQVIKGERSPTELMLKDAGIKAIKPEKVDPPPVQYVRIERRRNQK